MARSPVPDPSRLGQRSLHPLEFRILMALLDGPTYGSNIVRELEAQPGAGPKLYPANLFRRIRDLLAKGFIEECERPEGADTRRTYMRLTLEGRAAARASAENLRDLVREAVDRRLLEEF